MLQPLIIILAVLPVYVAWKAGVHGGVPLKGLALPQGSVRSMPALAVDGSFIVPWCSGHPRCLWRARVSPSVGGKQRHCGGGRPDSEDVQC